MSPNTIHPFRPTRFTAMFLLLAASGLMLAQDPLPSNPQPRPGGWRRVDEPAPPLANSQRVPVIQSQDPAEPVDRSDAYGQPQQSNPPANPPGSPEFSQPAAPPRGRPAYGLPAEVTLKSGAFIIVRTDQPLSSDHNQPGDTFSGTLVQPVVVDGVVVAQRGETVYGRVAEAQKARSGNSSRLGLELTGLTLADGTQVPVRSQLVARQGSTTPAGEQVGTVATTTAIGAVVGAAADWGRGAAIGAGAGAAAGIVGVLLTRNHPTVVYPETALTFQTESPVPINLARAPQAFRYVGPDEYNRPHETRLAPRPGPVMPAPGYYYGPGYYGYPYYYGPSVSLYFGRGPGYFYGRGYYRGWR